MPDRLTPTQRAVKEREERGKTMYGHEQPVGDDLFGDVEKAITRNQFGAFKMTATGIEIGDHATQQDWHEVGQFLFSVERSFQWLIGDWLAYGEDIQWGDIPAIADEHGYNKDTLANYASISRHCHISLRHEKLTYSHHVVIARDDLTDEQKSAWLQIAEKEQWSVRKLRTEVEKAQLPAAISSGEMTTNPPPPDDETGEEEATDKTPPVSLDNIETWEVLYEIRRIVKRRDYVNLDEQQARVIHRKIAAARRCLSLLEAELPRLPRGK